MRHAICAGEYLPFSGPIVTEGRPEEWLNRVEEAMFATTKKHLYKVLEESKGKTTAP
jgi:dynein heavy chain